MPLFPSRLAERVAVVSRIPIRRGASGRLMLTAGGRLVGVTSWSEEPADGRPADRGFVGTAARPDRALPVWILEHIHAAELSNGRPRVNLTPPLPRLTHRTAVVELTFHESDQLG